METLTSTRPPAPPIDATELTTSTTNNNKDKHTPIQAYAKLESDDQCYYIRTLQVTMGRKVARRGTVDIPLTNAKSVSRQHARLFYNFATQRFEMMVFGKNGAFINDQFVEKGVTVPLKNKTKIQIGDSCFMFLLPRMNLGTSGSGGPSSRSMGDHSGSGLSRQSDKQGGKATAMDQDDESYTTNKDIKPPFSYASLIAQAINSTEDKRMALHEIYNYITTHYPYYQMAQNGWQNSIRHNLSLNKAFVKVPRGDAEPGKGAFWTIDPKAEIQFMTPTVTKRNSKRSSKSESPLPEQPRKRSKKDASDEEDGEKAVKKEPSASNTINDHHRPITTTTTTSTSSSSSPKATHSNTTTKSTSPVAQTSSSATTTSSSPSLSTATTTTTAPVTSTSTTTSTSSPAVNNGSQQQQNNIQAQIQLQLQATIRQHLLDPLRNPLPPSIAQLLPQAIAQLPPHLASQFSATLQSALRAHSAQSNQENNSGSSSSSSSTNNGNGGSNNNEKNNSTLSETATTTTTTATATTTAAAAAATAAAETSSTTSPPSSPAQTSTTSSASSSK